MDRRVSLTELIRNAGIVPADTRQPCLPAPTQSAVVATDDDVAQARNILLDRRIKNPENKGKLKNIFRSSKEKEKTQDLGQFSQDELDQALSAVLRNPATGPGIIQAFLGLGAKVNIIEAAEKKKRLGSQANSSARRRSTVLQQAATLRRADSVSLLASSGADQQTLDEGLKAALTANDQACIQELLRHGADINNFPNSLMVAVTSNDQNFVRLLLRAPKPLRPNVISSCLPAAVQQNNQQIVSLLISYGADPNYDSSSALNMAIGKQDWKLAVALVSGPIRLNQATLQRLLDTTMRLPTCEATLHYLQLLFCCGLPPNSIGLPDLLICTTRKNNTAGAKMMLSYGVPTTTNEAECLREALQNSNWTLVDVILSTPVTPQHASAAMAVVPTTAPQAERLRIIKTLLDKGATGPPLGRWLSQAMKEGDSSLIELLIASGAPVDGNENSPLQVATARKDVNGIKLLLKARPSPETLANLFPLLGDYPPSERREVSRLLLESGARGVGVDQALVDAVADTSSARDGTLITDLVRKGADVNYANGKAISLATVEGDLSLLRLLCNSRPKASSTAPALPLAFDSHGNRHPRTLEIINLLLTHGIEEKPAIQALHVAINGGSENIDIVKRLIAADSKLTKPAFEYTIALEDPNKKAPFLEVFLNMGIAQEALDQALAVEIRHAVSSKDTSASKLLLGKGASVSHNDGEALSIAVAAGNSGLTELLLSGKHKPSRSSTTRAFRTLFTHETKSPAHRFDYEHLGIIRSLLGAGVEQLAVDAALRSVLRTYHGNVDADIVDVLLEHNANVNTADGACFVFAAQKRIHSIYEKLMQHSPQYRIIVPALLNAELDEDEILFLVQSAFKNGCTADELQVSSKSSTTPVLVLAMQNYPRHDALTKLLLAQGCNPDISVPTLLDPQTGEESVSGLIWAVNQPQKRISSPVITALLEAGASVTRAASVSEITPIILAAREGRGDLLQTLLDRGSDVNARDKWNRSALFYASSGSNVSASTIEVLGPVALKNDGSLHEAARCLRFDFASLLIKNGHDAGFPSRLHGGRNALGELCLHAQLTNNTQRSKLRQILPLLLNNGASPKFKARGEKSVIFLALDNPYQPLEITEALLETDAWRDLNEPENLFQDTTSGLWYSPLKYVELFPAPSRASSKNELLTLLREKGCAPRYYSDTPVQPVGAIGIPPPIAKLVDRQKEHELSLRHTQERHEHQRTLEETKHRDDLRRTRESQDAELAAATAAQNHWKNLEQQKHDFEVQRVRQAEHMKRSEKVAWHNLMMEQERDAAARRAQAEERRASASAAGEAKMIEARKGELEHRARVESRMLKEKEEAYERNVGRQKELMKRADESAQLHARMRQDRPQIEGAPQWGSVD